jgi:cell wall-associated NlpC family hydrolase
MSFSDTAMPRMASSNISRRRFVKRAVGTLAATAALGFGTSALAQETGVVAEDVTLQERIDTEAYTDVAAAAPVANGQYIANFALQFVGYPYVWAGNTPGGFDCSGFTQYVILNTVGIDIGHGTGGQMNYGMWVDAGNLQPGDLVYFAGTFGDGISHTGVYIGDGQFVHAENEGTGVTISWLWSDYYAAHYYGATRLW